MIMSLAGIDHGVTPSSFSFFVAASSCAQFVGGFSPYSLKIGRW
jgi:hypothetical protein